VAPATWLINGDVTAIAVQLGANGSLDGPGSLSVNGTLVWLDGVIQGNGTLNLYPGAICTIDGAATKTLQQRTLNNLGTIVWRGAGGGVAGAGASLNNFSGSTLDLQTNVVLAFNNSGALLKINNAGTFLKSAGNGVSPLAVDFNNSGTVDIATGDVRFQGQWQQTAGSTTVEAGAVAEGAEFDLQAGTLTGAGTLNARLTNCGAVRPGASPGTLTIAGGNDYQQAATGTLIIEIGGKSAGTQYSQLAIAGAASLAGGLELRLINGFIPQPGDTFQLLTCAARAGTFSGIGGSPPAGTLWMPRYTGTNVTLTLASQVTLAGPSLAGGTLRLPFNTTAGFAYVVQKTDILSPADWQTLATVQGTGALEAVEDSAAQSQAFYRVLMQ
jgi:hypothetical protein